MSEVKLFRLCGSTPVIDMRTGHNATLRPGLAVMSEDTHTHAIAAIEAECERLRNAPCECGAPVGYVSGEKYAAEHERLRECRKERDALRAELAAIKGQEAVAWMIDWPDEPELGHYFSDEQNEHARSRPLYTTPSQPVVQTAVERVDLTPVPELRVVERQEASNMGQDQAEDCDQETCEPAHCACKQSNAKQEQGEVQRLREALESCMELIETISPFEGDTVRKARAALAAHNSKQEAP